MGPGTCTHPPGCQQTARFEDHCLRVSLSQGHVHVTRVTLPTDSGHHTGGGWGRKGVRGLRPSLLLGNDTKSLPRAEAQPPRPLPRPARGPAHRPYQIACRWAVSGRCYFLQLPAAGRPGKGQWGGETETGEKHSTWSGGPEERRLATPPGAPIVPPPTSSSEAQLQPPAITFHQGRGTQTGLRKGLGLEW